MHNNLSSGTQLLKEEVEFSLRERGVEPLSLHHWRVSCGVAEAYSFAHPQLAILGDMRPLPRGEFTVDQSYSLTLKLEIDHPNYERHRLHEVITARRCDFTWTLALPASVPLLSPLWPPNYQGV